MVNEVTTTTDSRPYKSLITDIGNAKMTRAVLDGRKVNIVEMRLGDGGGSYYLPTTAATTLINEVWRGEIASKTINEASPNIIAVKAVIPSDVGGFTIREASLHDDEGDMIAVCNMPEIAKATLLDGISSSLDIVMNILLSNVDAVRFVSNPTLDPVSRDDMEQAMAVHNADPNAHNGAVGAAKAFAEITIPKEGWARVGMLSQSISDSNGGAHVEEDNTESGGMFVDIPIEGVTEAMVPFLAVYQADMGTAQQCGMSASIRTLDGILRVYAREVPAAEIHASLALVSTDGTITSGGGYSLPAATATRLGGVKVGDGLTVAPDGTLTVNPDKVMTAEDLVDENEVAQSVATILNGDEAR